MKIKLAFTTIFILLLGFLKAQTVSISPDSNKISFIINCKTTKVEIQKADSIFKAHRIYTKIKTGRIKKQISKLNIVVNCAQGNVNYHTDNADILKNGVMILVDKSKNATVALSVGPYKEQK